MLSISNPMKGVGAAVQYYLDERKEDYYLNGLDKQGRWYGGAAEKLGLAGRPVTREEFRNLLDGFTPDGREALVQNAGQPNRDACWDMTFNVPKELSVVWAMSPPATRQLIEQEVQEAVKVTLTKAQEIGGITRSGPGGKIKERADLMWATFQEGTSRAQDPHLHIHAVLINFGRRQNGRFGSLYTPNLFRWKMPLGAIFQAELASRIANRFGLQIEAREVGFGIRGVPQDLCRHLSKRRQVIEQTMRERGVSGAIDAKTAAKDTRPKKEAVSPGRLFPHWQEVGLSFGWRPEQVMNLRQVAREKPITAKQLDKRVQETVQKIPPPKQSRSRLVRAAARVAIEHGADGITLFQTFNQLRMYDDSRVLWQPHWQGQTTVKEPATKEFDSRHERQQSRQPTKKTKSRTHAPRHPVQEEASAVRSQSLPPEERQHETPGQQPQQPQQGPHHVRPDQARAEQDQPDPRQPLSGEQNVPPRSESNQTAGQDERRESHHQHDTEANQTRRSQGGRRKGNGRTRAVGRKGAPKNQAQTKRAKASERRKLLRLRWKALYDRRPWIPERGRFLHTHWKQPFKHALWGPARNLQIPSIGIELPRLGLGAPKPFVPRWRSIRWKKDLIIGEVRIQNRMLFRNAPKWSPLHGLTLPALRFTFQKSKSKAMKAPIKSSRPSKQEGKSKDHGHTH